MRSGLKFYEQHYGNLSRGYANEHEAWADMATTKRILEQRWPDGIWTWGPFLSWSEGRLGWQGYFAPQGVLEIPNEVTLDA